MRDPVVRDETPLLTRELAGRGRHISAAPNTGEAIHRQRPYRRVGSAPEPALVALSRAVDCRPFCGTAAGLLASGSRNRSHIGPRHIRWHVLYTWT